MSHEIIHKMSMISCTFCWEYNSTQNFQVQPECIILSEYYKFVRGPKEYK